MLSRGHYPCPMVCSQVLNGMASALSVVGFDAGKDFDIVTVSIDPHDTPREAMDAKKKYLSRYRRPTSEQGWHFLTGKQDQIAALASAVGFRYAWDPQIQQFAHPSASMLPTPDSS